MVSGRQGWGGRKNVFSKEKNKFLQAGSGQVLQRPQKSETRPRFEVELAFRVVFGEYCFRG